HYREFNQGLPGHPEKELTPGVEFSSGRLGHMWAFCNGIAMANPGKSVMLLGSDGSQMEGDNAEAARLSVGKELGVKCLIDDNNVTISGHPQQYMAGYDLSRTLAGYGLQIETVLVFDNDLMGSQGLHHIAKKHPEVFVEGGIMERGNFSAAAGFGYVKGKQGIYSTFSAFLEMCVSEITMSRLNFANVLAHFSHSGNDDMADNTCHFGINSMFADGGVKQGHGED